MGIQMKFKPPYPTIGRQLQIIAQVLGTGKKPGIAKTLENLANEPSINLDKLTDAMEQVIKLPFEYPKPKDVIENGIPYNQCEEFVIQLKEDLFNLNVANINIVPAENFPNEIERHKSIIPFIAPVLQVFITQLFRNQQTVREILLSEAPLPYGLNLILKEYPAFLNCFHGSERDKVQRWIAGKQFPSTDGLFDVINKAKDELGENYIWCCEIAFAAQTLQKTSDIAKPIYPIQIFFKSLIDNTSSRYEEFKNDENHLAKLSLLQKHFISAQEGIRFCAQQNPPTCVYALTRFANVCAALKINSTAVEWRFNMLVVLSYIYEGRFNDALELLKKVMPNLFYTTNVSRTAFYLKDAEKKTGCSLFRVALAVGAICENKPFLKMMKTYGIIFGIFGEPMEVLRESYNKYPYVNKVYRSTDNIVEDWEIEQWANDFFNLFSEKDVKNIDSIKEKKTNVHLPLFFEWGEKPQCPTKPYNKPFRILWKTYPQLVWFSQMCDVDAVKFLLDAKVDVNALSSSGESALLFSIESMVYNTIPFKPDIGKELFNLISSHPHDRKILLTPTNKKKLTCLGQAILTGEIDVVKKLIEMGADVNQIQSTDRQSPLYRAIQYSVPETAHFSISHILTSPEALDGIRRGNEIFRNLTNEEVSQAMTKWENNPQFFETRKWVKQHFEDQRKKCCSKEKMFSIAKVLLENGANPNQKHNVNGLVGYTPLMMATEHDLLDLFKLMLDYGGDLNQTARDTGPYRSTISCWDIAVYWKAKSIIQYLKEIKKLP